MIADNTIGVMNGYTDDVLSGRILASKAVQGACQRHMKDLDRVGQPGFPYYFNEKAAAKAINFYPAICRHSIGKWAGMPFVLEPWQQFIEGCIFGWQHVDTDLRRFTTIFETVGRKNGKSFKTGCRGVRFARYDHNPVLGRRLGKSYVPEPVSQIVLAAAKREQADAVIFKEIERMRRASPNVESRSKVVHNQVRFHDNDGVIMTVGSNKPYDGLNPSCVIMDEIHSWPETRGHRDFWNTMTTGSGSRDQPVISYVTTAGSDQSLIWLEVYNYAKMVALGEVEDDRYFAYIAELDPSDDVFDESLWIKANPNLGVSIDIEFLRDQARKARTSEVEQAKFTRYHCNRLVSSHARAFSMEKWRACSGVLSDWSGADCITAGVDVGSRDDLASYSLVARFTNEDGERRYEVISKSYISDNTHRDLNLQPFYGFKLSGLLTVSPHPLSQLQADLVADCRQYGCRKVAYDPAMAQQMSEDLQQSGLICASASQSYAWMNEPVTELIRLVNDKGITHSGDKLLEWAVGNAITVSNPQLKVMFDKSKSSEKIDPVVSMTMAFRLATLEPDKITGSLYI